MNGSRVVSQIFMCILTAMLKQQGVNVKGLLKGAPTKDEMPPLFDKSGKLEVRSSLTSPVLQYLLPLGYLADFLMF